MSTTLGRYLRISINPNLNDWPWCESCNKVVDFYMRRLDYDAMRGVKHDPKLIASPSLARLYMVRCHGQQGLLQIDYKPWQPAGASEDSGPPKG